MKLLKTLLLLLLVQAASAQGINVGKMHNDIMLKMLNGRTESAWQSYVQSLTPAGKEQVEGQLAGEIVSYTYANYGISVTQTFVLDQFASFNNSFNSIDPGKTWDLTVDQCVNLGYSNQAATSIVSALNALSTYQTDAAACNTAIQDIKSNLSPSLSQFERQVLESFCDLCVATNKLWIDVPGDGTQGRGGPAKADAIGFVHGAIHGGMHGAVFGGGIPGAIAGGLLVGAFEALTSSALDYWWRP